ncbi:hypothetical protein [Candidatus Endomicrobiellum trichonymphae]|uniref:Lipoprotein n=1 Tax=Endomicrobium trichonymphae TaxID=1408204 RepID=B1H0I3_ENDTX|nr:hypothetical protein [Candidatus Endomicrobium trichonymphae]BAG14015.1 hypothetical protein TGRD_522 [Candidatus Endomicrobium trichonymphae]
MKKGILAFVVSVFVLSFVSCDKTNKLCNGNNAENEAKAEEYAANKKLFLNKEFDLLGKTVTSADLEKWFKDEHGIEYGDIKIKLTAEQKLQSDHIATVKEKEQKNPKN